MTNNQLNNQPKRNPGAFSVSDNKLRIQNSTGQSSVLFEDISSITWKRLAVPNLTFILIGFAVSIVGIIIGSDSGTLLTLAFFGGIGLIIYGYMNKIIWDDVIIETRGGMLLSYSVDEDQGQVEVNRIENARRIGSVGV